MILFFLEKFFGLLIGNLPESRKKILWEKLTDLLDTALYAGARGVSEGGIERLRKKYDV